MTNSLYYSYIFIAKITGINLSSVQSHNRMHYCDAFTALFIVNLYF